MHVRVPEHPLSDVVAAIWIDEGQATADPSIRLPIGDVDLVSQLPTRREFRADFVVVGPSDRPVRLEDGGHGSVLGISLRLGMARSLIGIPLRELRDAQVPLSELRVAGADELLERVSSVAAAPARLAMVERSLTDRLARHWRPPHAVAAWAARQIAASPETYEADALARPTGLSPRRLEEIFRIEIGLGPKRFQRLQRFRRALSRIDDAKRLGWAAFAAERGYYDQAHFINEFRRYTGLAPSAYLRIRGPALNHLPLAGRAALSSKTPNGLSGESAGHE